MRGRFSDDGSTAFFGGLNIHPQELSQIDRIIFIACGTAWHACLIAEYLIERFARIPVEVEYASEFRYRNAPLDKIHWSLRSANQAKLSTRYRHSKKRNAKATKLYPLTIV